MKMLVMIQRNPTFFLLLFLMFGFFLLRIPSLIEPYWYGDEGIYQAVGIALRSDKILYTEVWDNKPPLLYYIYALFSSDQFTLRMLSAILGTLSVASMYFLAKKLFRDKLIALTSAIIFIFLFATPLLEGNIANAENFMLLPTILSFFLFYKTITSDKSESKKTAWLFISGLLVGIAFTIKIVAVFDLAACIFFYFFFLSRERRSLRLIIDNFFSKISILIPYLIGFSVPFLLFSLYFVAIGNSGDFISSIFAGNISYVGFENELLIPQGYLFLKIIILSVLLTFLFIKRKIFSIPLLFVLTWFFFSLFNSFFSQRPYAHYVIVMLPSFCLLMAYFINKTSHRFLLGGILMTSLFLVIFHFNFFMALKTPAYYQTFFSFLTGGISFREYSSYFDKNTVRDYDVALYLRENTDDSKPVFIWGNSAQVYTLSNTIPSTKYTVEYHVRGNEEAIDKTYKDVTNTKPSHVVVYHDVEPMPFQLPNYSYIFTIRGADIYERTY